MNYYERHIGDYLRDTAHLSLLEHGIYGRLLDVYYTREAGIPRDSAERLIGARAANEIKALGVVLQEFFTLVDGEWTHTRCEREIERYQKKVEHNRSVGKLGGRPKKPETQEKPPGLFPGSQTEPKHNPLQTPDTSKEIEPPLPSVVSPLPENPPAKEKAKPAPKIGKPDGVDQQVWIDWCALRKEKKASVSPTVLKRAMAEAVKANLTLDGFLQVWCLRGTQGLEASWLKSHERGPTVAEPAWRTEQRARTAAFAGPYGVRYPVSSSEIIEAEDAPRPTHNLPPKVD